MIDFHTHILPNMDDGSQSLEQAREMIKREQAEGIQDIIATPHFYADRVGMDSFLLYREKSMQAVQKMMEKEMWERPPRIYGGAEVYYFPGIGRASEISKLCVEGTSLLLLELPFSQWDQGVYQDVAQLAEEQELTVIVAHIERYFGFQKKKDIWDAVFELPVYAQMNAGAFLTWKERMTSMKLLKKGYRLLLGSDCHDLDRRPPNLAAGREVIRKKAGESFLEEIDQNGREIMRR